MKNITLATLPQATAQQVFNQVARHLLTQGKPALNELGKCSYRTTDGLSCAAGCLISDDEYAEMSTKKAVTSATRSGRGIEDATWHALSGAGYVPVEHEGLIDALQSAHDAARNEPEHQVTTYWLQRLERVAREHKLHTTVLDQFRPGRITLANLADATEQQVFDQVARHLMKQGKPATHGGACQYRTNVGASCAAGCLMTDAEYEAVTAQASNKHSPNRGIEGDTWNHLAGHYGIPTAHQQLIRSLQDVHDSAAHLREHEVLSHWRNRLVTVAERYGLSASRMLAEHPVLEAGDE